MTDVKGMGATSAPRVCASSGLLEVPFRRGGQLAWAPARRAGKKKSIVLACCAVIGLLVGGVDPLRLCGCALVTVVTLGRQQGTSEDPGGAAAAKWLDEGADVVFEQNGVFVTEVAVSGGLGGCWRCLCTTASNGGVVTQSAARIVGGQVHPGALVGYTRLLGLTALVAARRAESPRVLNLGLGGGTVPAFLAAHANATVLALEIDADVLAATAATMTPPAHVELLEADAVEFVLEEGELYDAVVVDLFDRASRPPPAMTLRAFAQGLVGRVRPGGGLAMNVVRVNSLGESTSECSQAALEVVRCFSERGSCFITPAIDTHNAVLWCFDDDKAASLTAVIAMAHDRATSLGVLFDARRELRSTVRVYPEDLLLKLASLDS